MSDKERLERIKDIHERAMFEHGDGDRKFELRDIVYILWQEYHTDWLIEQAERAQSVEEENARLRKALAFYAYDSGDYTDKKIAKTALEGEK